LSTREPPSSGLGVPSPEIVRLEPDCILVVPLPTWLPPCQSNRPETIRSPSPETATPFGSPVTESVPEVTLRTPFKRSLAMDTFPVATTSPSGIGSMHTRSEGPGSIPVDQLDGVFQRPSAACPVHVTVQSAASTENDPPTYRTTKWNASGPVSESPEHE